VSDKKSWRSAQNFCKSKNAHLVIIDSETKQTEIYLEINESIWIGLRMNDGNNYNQWETGASVRYSNWRKNEPNNFSSDQGMKCK
jgi:hypothetical protein